MNTPDRQPDPNKKLAQSRRRRIAAGAVAGSIAMGGTAAAIAYGQDHAPNTIVMNQERANGQIPPKETPSPTATASSEEGSNNRFLRTELALNEALVFTVKDGQPSIHFRNSPKIIDPVPNESTDSNRAFDVEPGQSVVVIRPFTEKDENDNLWVGGTTQDGHAVFADESELSLESTSYITQFNAPAGQPTEIPVHLYGSGFAADNGDEVVAAVFGPVPSEQAAAIVHEKFEQQ
ncbi:MAG TPA: hypothetical protein VLG13_01390 [Patescibacteria group bacterium]|nr:hypothetical protein [Patescibacteria group bacterium]